MFLLNLWLCMGFSVEAGCLIPRPVHFQGRWLDLLKKGLKFLARPASSRVSQALEVRDPCGHARGPRGRRENSRSDSKGMAGTHTLSHPALTTAHPVGSAGDTQEAHAAERRRPGTPTLAL